MPTYSQYISTNNSYSSASNTALNNKIPLFQDYIQFRSGQSQYVLIIGKTDNYTVFTEATVYIVDGASGTQTISVAEYDTVNVDVTNSYYTYNSYDMPYYSQYQRNQALADSVIGFALTGGVAICVILAFLRRLFSRRR